MQQDATPTRRSVVTAGAAASLGAVGVAALAACGGSSASTGSTAGATAGSTAGSTDGSTTGSTTGSTAGSSASPSDSSTGEDTGSAAAPLAKLADVPVGGAVSVTAANGPVIVAQPTAGKVVAFSALCTHQGCTVAPSGKKLACPCHGSMYDAFTGKVLQGPAPAPLAAVAVKIQGQNIVSG